MAGEERACVTWEYARESLLLRVAWYLQPDAWKLGLLPVTPETVFLRDVYHCAPSDYLARDWITTSALWRTRLSKKATTPESLAYLQRTPFAFNRSGVLDVSAASWPGVEPLCVNWFAPLAEIEADLRRRYERVQVQSYLKSPKHYLVMLNALSAWRMHQIGGDPFRRIAQARQDEGWTADLDSLERMAKRDAKNAAGFFTSLFSGVELPVRMREP